MANSIFLGADLSIPTYAWKTSAGADNVNASFPVSNLKNYYPDIVSKSNSTGTDQYFLIDLGSARACDSIIIEGHNFNSVLASAAVRLQYNTNDDTDWADAVTAVNIMIAAEYTDEVVYKAFSSQTKRYWRILFDSTVAAAPQIGNIFLGTRLTMETTPWYPFIHGAPDFDVQSSRAIDGRLRGATTRGAIYRHRISFKLQTDAIVTAWNAFLLLARGSGRPFYYVDHDGNVWLGNLSKSFNPFEKQVYNRNNVVNVEIESTLAS
ncbi:MAG: hypothetical protein ACYC09_13020 [Bacteroidota bacterium]